MICKCNELEEINGRDAQDYAFEHLNKLLSGDNWETLYECPNTGIKWLEDFPHSDWHGGPPRFENCH